MKYIKNSIIFFMLVLSSQAIYAMASVSEEKKVEPRLEDILNKNQNINTWQELIKIAYDQFYDKKRLTNELERERDKKHPKTKMLQDAIPVVDLLQFIDSNDQNNLSNFFNKYKQHKEINEYLKFIKDNFSYNQINSTIQLWDQISSDSQASSDIASAGPTDQATLSNDISDRPISSINNNNDTDSANSATSSITEENKATKSITDTSSQTESQETSKPVSLKEQIYNKYNTMLADTRITSSTANLEIKSQILANNILKEIQKDKNLNNTLKGLYIPIFQKLQLDESAKKYFTPSPISGAIDIILSTLCRATLPTKLHNHYDTINLFFNNQRQQQDINNLINSYLSTKQASLPLKEKVEILQTLQLYYHNDEEKLKILQETQSSLEQPEKALSTKHSATPIQLPIQSEKNRQDAHKSTQAHFNSTVQNTISPAKAQQQKYADELTKSGYFSVELQSAALAAVNKLFKINIKTGVPENLPTAQEIIETVTNDESMDKKIKIDGLHAALEATHIALVAANLDVAYANPEYTAPALATTISPLRAFTINIDLLEILEYQKKQLTQELHKISPNWLSQTAASMYKFLFGAGQYLTRQNLTVPISESQIVYELNKDLVAQIIKKNDYTQQFTYDAAANLLFKQCLIAQQHRLSDIYIPINQKNNISAINYIFNNIPTLDQLCHLLQERIEEAEQLKKPTHEINQIKAETHEILLTIRQSIQIALYIANKNSNFYAGSILPATLTAYLDGTVKQLLIYDQQLSKLCKDPNLGATAADLVRDKFWNQISLIMAGVAIAGIIYTDYNYGLGSSLHNIKAGAYNSAASIYNMPNNIYNTGQNIYQAASGMYDYVLGGKNSIPNEKLTQDTKYLTTSQLNHETDFLKHLFEVVTV